MASLPRTFIPVEEYLRTSYRPDCEYLDGVVEERNLGERDHSWVQGNIVTFFRSRFKQTGLTAMPDWRFQTAATRFRVPDVVVVQGKPAERILTRAPLLCIEILSPEDTVSRTNIRIQEYLAFGVPVVWLIDPTDRRIWIYRSSGMAEPEGDYVRLDGISLEIPLSEIFD